MTISDREKKVLEWYVDKFKYDEDIVFTMKHNNEEMGLEYSQLRRSVRSLARKGMMELIRGLINDDGILCGSGYIPTDYGVKVIEESLKKDEQYCIDNL
jgi:hypothetical protein